MASGGPGDHPLTDILIYSIPTFSPEADGLIRELDALGAWEGELISFLVLGLHVDLERLRSEGRNDHADTMLHNFVFMLRGEHERLAGRP